MTNTLNGDNIKTKIKREKEPHYKVFTIDKKKYKRTRTLGQAVYNECCRKCL